ncbi:hypothetical protein ACFL54_07240 [Planctomycetota bacterium]
MRTILIILIAGILAVLIPAGSSIRAADEEPDGIVQPDRLGKLIQKALEATAPDDLSGTLSSKLITATEYHYGKPAQRYIIDTIKTWRNHSWRKLVEIKQHSQTSTGRNRYAWVFQCQWREKDSCSTNFPDIDFQENVLVTANIERGVLKINHLAFPLFAFGDWSVTEKLVVQKMLDMFAKSGAEAIGEYLPDTVSLTDILKNYTSDISKHLFDESYDGYQIYAAKAKNFFALGIPQDKTAKTILMTGLGMVYVSDTQVSGKDFLGTILRQLQQREVTFVRQGRHSYNVLRLPARDSAADSLEIRNRDIYNLKHIGVNMMNYNQGKGKNRWYPPMCNIYRMLPENELDREPDIYWSPALKKPEGGEGRSLVGYDHWPEEWQCLVVRCGSSRPLVWSLEPYFKIAESMGRNVLFGDGHVECLKEEDFQQSFDSAQHWIRKYLPYPAGKKDETKKK